MSSAAEYDRFPYHSNPFPQSHPQRLAALGRLFGVDAPEVKTARVLELGCASGGNLLPLAYYMPNASFVGIDFSGRQLEQGREIAKRAGLDNVELIHGDIAELDESHTDFDYIICHGVYSWVPDSVQHAIMRICRDRLTTNGIAYISYNVYPGWHMRSMIRDMMLYHTASLDDPVMKVGQARALLDFMASNAGDSGAYPTLLNAELEGLRKAGDYYLRHEHLSEDNSSVYFHEFAARADSYALQYLAEADLSSMISSNLSTEVATTLAKIAPDIIRMEQYMDFLRNRTFRQTLLTHRGVTLNRHLTGESLRTLHLTGQLQPPEQAADGSGLFKNVRGAAAGTRNQIMVDWLEKIRATAPQSVPVAELLDAVGSDNPVVGTGDDLVTASGAELAQLVCTGFLELRGEPVPRPAAVSERPQATSLAREQLKHTDVIADHTHQPVRVNFLSKNLIFVLDGTRTVDDLIDHLTQRTLDGELNMQRDGNPVTNEDEIRRIMAETVPTQLVDFANRGLLVA